MRSGPRCHPEGSSCEHSNKYLIRILQCFPRFISYFLHITKDKGLTCSILLGVQVSHILSRGGCSGNNVSVQGSHCPFHGCHGVKKHLLFAFPVIGGRTCDFFMCPVSIFKICLEIDWMSLLLNMWSVAVLFSWSPLDGQVGS